MPQSPTQVMTIPPLPGAETGQRELYLPEGQLPPGEYGVMDMPDDSMEGLGIRAGDRLVILLTQEAPDGAAAVAMVDGHLLVRQLFRNPDGCLLQPCRVGLPAVSLKQPHILGRVVLLQRTFI